MPLAKMKSDRTTHLLLHITIVLSVFPQIAVSGNMTRDTYVKLKSFITSMAFAMDMVPPKVDPNDTTTVLVDFEPMEILYVDEVLMVMVISTYLRLSWDDPAFHWDPVDYEGLDRIQMPSHKLWTPILANYKSVYSRDMIINTPSHVTVVYSGYVTWTMPATVTVSCQFDMANYPFDEQSCPVEFGAGGGVTRKIEALPAQTLQISTDAHHKSGEWILKSVESRIRTMNTSNPTTETTYVQFWITMQRRSMFYICNVIIPILATSLLTVVVFWIPAGTGEKLSFLVCLFISMTMFLSIISEMMPTGQAELSKLNGFIVMVVIKNFLAILATVYVIRRYDQETRMEAQSHTGETHDTSGEHAYKDVYALPANEIDYEPSFLEPLGGAKGGGPQYKTKVGELWTKNVYGFARIVQWIEMRWSKPLPSDTLDLIFFFVFLFGSLPFYITLFLYY